MNWLHYLAEANLYLSVFYLAHRLLLAKETYYQLNRAYLLFSCMAAFTLPVLQIGALKPVEVATVIPSYSTVLVYPIQTTHAAVVRPVVIAQQLNWQNYLIYAYALGCAVLLLVLLVKLFVLIRMIRYAKCEQHDKYKLIYLPESDIAFSFFNYLFIGTNVMGTKTIIRHELVHIRQRHSLDILFVELLKIINWFNPCIYLLQNSLKTLHEYIADEQTHENDTIAYATFLVNNAYGAGGSSITHSFFNYNLLKKRIIMLNQKRSVGLARLKYLVTIPLFAGLLCASTLAFSKDYGWVDLDPASATNAIKTIPFPTPPRPGELTPPPPPMLTAAGYNSLSYHLYKNISYHPSKTQKDSKALVTFSVTGDHRITDAKVVKSAGKELDAIIINAFNSFKLPVNDKPGKGSARIYFYTTDYSIFKDLTSPDNHKLDVMVDNKPHVYATTKKGYEYQLFDWYEKNKATGKIKYHADKVVIFEKNGEAKEFTPKSDLKILRGTYGFEWPEKKPQVKFPPPAEKANWYFNKNHGRVTPGRLNNSVVPLDPTFKFVLNNKIYDIAASEYKPKARVAISCDSMTVYEKGNKYAQAKWGKDVGKVVVLEGRASLQLLDPKPSAETIAARPDSVHLALMEKVLKELADHIRYPAIARNSNITGRVIAVVSVGDNGKIKYLNIVRSISNSISQEVFNQIKNNQALKKIPGNWTIPIFFSLAYPDGDEHVAAATPPPTETEAKTFLYNPDNMSLSNLDAKVFNEVVIRGYTKRAKN